MTTIKRKNPDAFNILSQKLAELDSKQAKAGWFASATYENGLPVAQNAYTQEFGATISHPGGTPYKIGADGKAQFVALSSPGAGALPKTKPHTIVIPPRPFIRPTIAREKETWFKIMAMGAKAVIAGDATVEQVMYQVSAKAAGDVAKTIATLQDPPLAKSTVRARVRKMANRKVVGNLTKPLVETGLMLNTLTNVVEDAQ